MSNEFENKIIQKLIGEFGFDRVCQTIRNIEPNALSLPNSIDMITSQEFLFQDFAPSVDDMISQLDEFLGLAPEKTPPFSDFLSKIIDAGAITSWKKYTEPLTYQPDYVVAA